LIQNFDRNADGILFHLSSTACSSGITLTNFIRHWNVVNEEIDGDADEDYFDVLDPAFVDIENNQFVHGQNLEDADEPIEGDSDNDDNDDEGDGGGQGNIAASQWRNQIANEMWEDYLAYINNA
jgi:hypothetical protein